MVNIVLTYLRRTTITIYDTDLTWMNWEIRQTKQFFKKIQKQKGKKRNKEKTQNNSLWDLQKPSAESSALSAEIALSLRL